MKSYADQQALLAALQQPIPHALKTAISNALAVNLGELTHILVITTDDTEQDIIDEIGWSPLQNLHDEIRYRQPGFQPYWACLTLRDGYFELIHPVGNDGFAWVLVIEDAGESDLLSMCREYVS